MIEYAALLASMAALVALLIGCARDHRKKKPDGPVSHPQPVSNSEATSKKDRETTHNSAASTPQRKESKTGKPSQPPSGRKKDDAQYDEERGERKKHKKENKKDDEKGVSVRISIHGEAPSSSENENDDERPYMCDIFDDATAKDDTLSLEAEERKKIRKGKGSKSLLVSDRVDTTQISSDQPTTTVDPTDNVTKECTQTGHCITQDQTVESTRETTKGDATISEIPDARMRKRQTGGQNRRRSSGGLGRNKKSRSTSEYDPSQTGETATESTKKRPRQKRSGWGPKSPLIPDAPSVTHKDSSIR